MKEIQLTRGKVALVDDEDFDWLNQWKWFALKDKYTDYARRNLPNINGKRSSIMMHRLILGITDFEVEVDHKDHNGLNNQRNNLRQASKSQNLANQNSHKNSSSKYLGVSLVKSKYKDRVYFTWRAQIMKDGVKFHLGCYKTEIEAAKSFNNGAIEIHGEFANLNSV